MKDKELADLSFKPSKDRYKLVNDTGNIIKVGEVSNPQRIATNSNSK